MALKISLAQHHPRVGPPGHAMDTLKHYISEAKEGNSDLIIFPECALTGYPPEDLLFRENWPTLVDEALAELAAYDPEMHVLIGSPYYTHEGLFNAAIHLYDGSIQNIVCKQMLPNEGVFDEKRYFSPGEQSGVIPIKEHSVGILICEDAWYEDIAIECKAMGAEALIQINASPFEQGKHAIRTLIAQERVEETNLPLISLYCAGAQDELVFDGGSFILNREAETVYRAPMFENLIHHHRFDDDMNPVLAELASPLENDAATYEALKVGLKNYLAGTQTKKVLVGLSGGIDSALTLAIAVDALGPEAVTAVRLPSPYTSELSMTLAEAQTTLLNVEMLTLPIEGVYDAARNTLDATSTISDITDQNLQSRARAMLMMALSNETGAFVLSTGNKSEMAVGYATLYGDMAGAYAVLKDVYKTQVYALAEYRNTLGQAIPEGVITRPPTAELKADQTDQDTLPSYEVLDAILQLHIEARYTPQGIIDEGFDADTVNWVINALERSEYKRQQSVLGPKITPVSFGKDWRMPLTIS